MNLSKASYIVAALSGAAYLFFTMGGQHQYAGWFLMGFFLGLAIGVRGNEILRGYSYTIMIFAAVALAMYYPQYFVYVGEFKLSKLIVPLLQLIMFGMGAALSWQDFARVLQMPKGVIVGLACQFTIMPFLGWSLTQIFPLAPEIAAGVILVGSSPSGLASNVIAYLARANLALSVTITALATMLAPVMTPFYMHFLAGEYIEVNFLDMMWDIVKIIIFPVGAGLLINHFLHSKFKWLNDVTPVISMASIGFIIVIITAAGRDSLLEVGLLLIVIVLIHNLGGYMLGYWSARAVGMKEPEARTIAIEVGLQNAGLASGLANQLGKLATVGLAAAVFGPVMNITGSTLGFWWRGRPVEGEKEVVTEKVTPHG